MLCWLWVCHHYIEHCSLAHGGCGHICLSSHFCSSFALAVMVHSWLIGHNYSVVSFGMAKVLASACLSVFTSIFAQSNETDLYSLEMWHNVSSLYHLCISWVRSQKVTDHRSLTPLMPAVSNCCCSEGSAPCWSNALFLIFDWAWNG